MNTHSNAMARRLTLFQSYQTLSLKCRSSLHLIHLEPSLAFEQLTQLRELQLTGLHDVYTDGSALIPRLAQLTNLTILDYRSSISNGKLAVIIKRNDYFY